MDSKEASDVIEKALNTVVSENEDWDAGDLIVDWVLIAYTTNPDKEKESAYPIFFSNGEMPYYRARGLFTTGLMYLDDRE